MTKKEHTTITELFQVLDLLESLEYHVTCLELTKLVNDYSISSGQRQGLPVALTVGRWASTFLK